MFTRDTHKAYEIKNSVPAFVRSCDHRHKHKRIKIVFIRVDSTFGSIEMNANKKMSNFNLNIPTISNELKWRND